MVPSDLTSLELLLSLQCHTFPSYATVVINLRNFNATEIQITSVPFLGSRLFMYSSNSSPESHLRAGFLEPFLVPVTVSARMPAGNRWMQIQKCVVEESLIKGLSTEV